MYWNYQESLNRIVETITKVEEAENIGLYRSFPMQLKLRFGIADLLIQLNSREDLSPPIHIGLA